MVVLGFSFSPRPIGTNWFSELGWTGLGLGQGVWGLVPWLDNKTCLKGKHCHGLFSSSKCSM